MHPLASVQQGIWLDQMLNPDLPCYILGVILDIDGHVDEALLESSINDIANANDALRLVLCGEAGMARQRVLPRVDVKVPHVDFSSYPDAHERARQHIRTAFETPFVLEGGLLWDEQLVRESASRAYWIHRSHHLVSDGISIAMICQAVVDVYNRRRGGDGQPLEAGPSYLQFLADDQDYLSSARYERDAQFWQDKFASLPAPLLTPLETQKRAGVLPDGQVFLTIERSRYDLLKALSAARGCTVAHALPALLAICFARTHHVDEVVIGMPVHNRSTARQKRALGAFASVVPIRIPVERNTSFADLMRGLAAEQRRCYRHQRFPIADLNRRLQLAKSGRRQLFGLTLSFEGFPGDVYLGDTKLGVTSMRHRFEQTPITVCLQDYHEGGDVVLEFNYDPTMFTREAVEDIQRRVGLLLTSVLEDGCDQPVGVLPLVDEVERERLLNGWNDTARDYPSDVCVHELFEAQVAQRPEAIAVVDGDERVSYADLNRRANRLARHLRKLGVGPDSRVAICVERSVEMVLGLLATLKAGGGYVPLDPDYPADRLHHMLGDSDPVVVLVDAVGQRALAQDDAAEPRPVRRPTLHLRDDAALWAKARPGNLGRRTLDLGPRHLAYVIYTSGSTGRPKGVMNEHRGVVNRILWMQEAYALTEHDVVLQKTPFSFDVSVWEFFWPLMAGARLVMARPHGHKDPAYLAEVIESAGVTTLHFVPSMLQAFLAHEGAAQRCASVVRVVCSGEALPASLARGFHGQLPHAELHNLYGPTEAAVDVTAWACVPGEDRTSVPIGRPIANTRIYILDQQMQPVPEGVAGELYIGGVQVARGYLNQPSLTAERFVVAPFSADADARLYKTGDLARWLADGAIEFLGRNDFQVKIRGFRIELGEIEATLAQVVGVREVAVVAREDAPGDKRLVAYHTGEGVSAEELRHHAAQQLPAYMVPAVYVHLAALPLTPNGKLDRQALPVPEGAAYASRPYEAPQGELEQTLAAIWAELLHVERVGRHDNFIELGGHSLLAVGLVERLRRQGLHTDVRVLYTAPTLAELATQVSRESRDVQVPPNRIPRDARRITPEMLTLVALSQDAIDRIVATVEGGAANVQDIYPLAPLQEGILFHHLLAREGDPYVLSGLLGFSSRARLDGFLSALQQVIDRHDILRTGFAWEGLEQPVQVVRRQAKLPVTFVELDASHGDIGQQLEARCDPRRARLDINEAPLLHCYAAHDPVRGGWLVHILFHHLAFDHTTLELVLEEAQAIERGELTQLPPPVPFRDFVAQAKLGVSEQEHEAFFKEMLSDVDEPTTPFGLLDAQGDGSDIVEVQQKLAPELSHAIRAQARRLGVSAASVMHLAWALVLARATGRQDMVFGTVLFGRMQGGAQADRVMGLFINTLPVRIRVDAQGIQRSLERTHALLVQLLRHEHAPLTLAQRCSGLPAQTPLFTALLNYRYSAHAMSEPAGQTRSGGDAIELLGGHERTNYPLTLTVDDLGEDFAVTAKVCERIAPQRVCAFIQTALEQIVRALEGTPERAACRIDVLPPAEREQLLVTWNDSASTYPRDVCVHQLFEAQVARTPDALAVVDGAESVSYAELNRRANRLAHYLRAHGVGPDCLVALAVERRVEMLVGLLGILKAGGAYVPLDPSYPVERLAYMLDDAKAMHVLTQASLQSSLPVTSAPMVALDAQWPEIAVHPESNPDRSAQTARDLAYVIYTSGSTGKPKGVMVEHRNLVNLWSGLEESIYRRHPACQRVSLNASIAFDSLVKQWVQLLSGRTLVLVPERVRFDGVALNDFIEASRIDVFDCTPSQLALIEAARGAVPGSFPAVTLVGGEAIGAALWHALAGAPSRAYYNVYGPTECTVDATIAPVTRDVAVPHIGRPIANTQVYILDGQLQPVPVGVAGELYIGGAGVTRGYLCQPALTAERFLSDSFSTGPDARLYKTGDVGRWLADGTIEFLGRNDHQVKVRGFRIELGEIEATLAQVAGVHDVVVVARADGTGDPRLVAYHTGAEVSAETLRHHAAQQLPAYMVPAAYVPLTALPLTPNGKLDRAALPAPEGDAYASSAYEAPQGAVEETLAEIWAELLQLTEVGRADHFFALGGHSLLAVQMVSRVRTTLGVELALSTVFEHPTLAALAAQLGGASATALAPIPAVARGGPLPLSLAQQRLWFLTQLDGVSEAYHISGAARLEGVLDRATLQRALQRIVERHEALRTLFVRVAGEPMQVVQDAAEAALPLTVHDLRGRADAAAAAEALRAADTAAAFDLTRELPIRVLLLQLADDVHVLHVVLHHIAADGWSVGVLLQELSAVYGAFVQGAADPLPALPLQYADYAAWQRAWLDAGQLDVQRAFWQTTLADAPPLLELPSDRSRPAQQDLRGATVSVRLEPAVCEGLRTVSQRHGVTLYMSLLASWAAVLGRLSGQDTIVIGSPIAGRTRAEIEGLIGFFVNTLALRIDLDGAPTVAALLERTKAQVLAAQQHQDLPFDQVVEAVQPPRTTAHTPLFQVMFDWHNTPARELVLPEVRLTPLETALTTAPFDLTLSLEESAAGIAGTLNYATALFDQATVERYLRYWTTLLEAMVADDRQLVSRLPLLDAAERQQLLVDWNTTAQTYPSELCVHHLFEAQAAQTPEAIAVADGVQRVSYAELNRRANQLARYLRTLGVVPDSRVAVCIDRSVELVVALLAIVKAGGAYVPLDPSYPAERLEHMRRDSAPVAVLTHGRVGGAGPIPSFPSVARAGHDGAVIDVQRDAERWQDEATDNLSLSGQSSRHLAYVIYTSGSTGQPKGVLIEHRSLVNYTLDAIRWFGLTSGDTVWQQNSLNFDLSLEEILPALLAGATLVPSNVLFGLADQTHSAARPSVVHLTAAHWHSLVGEWRQSKTYAQTQLAGVRLINVTGDALSPQTLAHWDAIRPAHTRLINTYGPTEITISCSAAYVRHDPTVSRVSIGRPFANTRMYILDSALAPVPIGVAGELYIGGVGVARGYLNQPALTAERFLDDPFVPGGRLYRTGDLACWRPDGEIAFIGRTDFQAKVRGFRIELGEVEATLAQAAGVQEMVVVARAEASGEKALVAYYTGADASSVAALRQHAAQRLPAYMVPAAYVHLAALPVTPSGKLDRTALPAPASDAYASRAYAAPQGEAEEALTRIWAELLKLEQVGRHDNFFELGGHSLLAVSLIERMRQEGLHADVTALFTTPTLADLATQVSAGSRDVHVPPNLILHDSDALGNIELEEFRL